MLNRLQAFLLPTLEGQQVILSISCLNAILAANAAAAVKSWLGMAARQMLTRLQALQLGPYSQSPGVQEL